MWSAMENFNSPVVADDLESWLESTQYCENCQKLSKVSVEYISNFIYYQTFFNLSLITTIHFPVPTKKQTLSFFFCGVVVVNITVKKSFK